MGHGMLVMKRFEKPILVTRPYLPPLEEFKRGCEEIWATNIIKAYLLRGRAENRELDELKKNLASHEQRLTRVEQGVETIVRTLLPPIQKHPRIGFGDDNASSKPYGKK